MRRGRARRTLTTLVSTFALLYATRSRAETRASDEAPCVVRVMPSDVAGEWRRASADLRHRVRQWPTPDRDCRELLVEVRGDAALLTITTRDGRQAQRAVATPSALVPAASALAVSVETPTLPAPAETTTASAAGREIDRPIDRMGALFLAGGVRAGAPGVFWAPVIRGAVALQLGRWDVGTYVDWAPQHWLTAHDAPPGFRMWSLSSGLSAGRREPVGAIDLLAGVMFGATFVHQESTTTEVDDDTIEVDVEEGDGVDLVLGGYMGMATPRQKPVRLRAQVEFTLPALHPGQRRELDSDLPPLPGWSLSALVGVEFGAP